MLTLNTLPKIIHGTWLKKPATLNKELVGLAFDTRLYKNEDIFLCLMGKERDAHDFLGMLNNEPVTCFIVGKKVPTNHPTAGYFLVSNTVQALADLAHHQAKHFKGKILAITGSTGKTSLKSYLGKIFSAYMPTLVPEKSYNNQVGCPTTLMGLTKAHKLCILEMGANSMGEIRALSQIAMSHYSLITNVGMSHVGRFGSLANTQKEKSQIFSFMRLPAMALLPKDLANLPTFSAKKVVIYDEAYPVKLEKAFVDGSQALSFVYREKPILCRVPLMAASLPRTVSAILSLADAFALPADVLKRGLESLQPAPGRLVIKQSADQTYWVDDTYNANPNSVVHLAESITPLEAPFKMVILGDLAELEGFEKESANFIAKNFPKKACDRLWVYGNFAALLKKNFIQARHPVKLETFADQKQLIAALEKFLPSLPEGKLIACKGSRVSNTEAIIQHFFQPLGKTSASKSAQA